MSAALRLTVRQRANARCEYCRLPDLVPHLMRFHLEHIRARRHQGPTSLNNLAWACARCNERKGTNLSGVDPDTNRLARIFNPRRDGWSRHFVWEGLRIRGVTAAGRGQRVALGFQFRGAAQAPAGIAEAGSVLNEAGNALPVKLPFRKSAETPPPRLRSRDSYPRW